MKYSEYSVGPVITRSYDLIGCAWERVWGLTTNGVWILLGLKVHRTILRNLFISTRTKQDYHSLATQGRLIIITMGGLIWPQPWGLNQYSVLVTKHRDHSNHYPPHYRGLQLGKLQKNFCIHKHLRNVKHTMSTLPQSGGNLKDVRWGKCNMMPYVIIVTIVVFNPPITIFLPERECWNRSIKNMSEVLPFQNVKSVFFLLHPPKTSHFSHYNDIMTRQLYPVPLLVKMSDSIKMFKGWPLPSNALKCIKSSCAPLYSQSWLIMFNVPKKQIHITTVMEDAAPI